MIADRGDGCRPELDGSICRSRGESVACCVQGNALNASSVSSALIQDRVAVVRLVILPSQNRSVQCSRQQSSRIAYRVEGKGISSMVSIFRPVEKLKGNTRSLTVRREPLNSLDSSVVAGQDLCAFRLLVPEANVVVVRSSQESSLRVSLNSANPIIVLVRGQRGRGEHRFNILDSQQVLRRHALLLQVL